MHSARRISRRATSRFRSIAAVAIALACGWPSPSLRGEDYRVGVLYWSMNIKGQVAMREGLEAEASRIDKDAAREGSRRLKLVVRVAGDGERGIARQVEQMRELVAAKVDVIIVQPTDNAALGEPLREANASGIPVVAYDQYIDGGKLAAYRSSDNYQAGYLDGEYLASRRSTRPSSAGRSAPRR